MKPYYDDGTCVIYHGDALEVMPNLADKSVGLVLTDPPYNVGFAYASHADDMPDYASWCHEWWAECDRLADRIVVFPGCVNLLPVWSAVRKPSFVGAWFIPGKPGRGGAVQFTEWEPWLYWGASMGGSNVIRATVTRQLGVGEFPCPKPLRLFRELITRAKAEMVLDPFMGSGTTLRAAKDLGRSAIGIEIEERYCEIAAKRLGQEVLDFGVSA